MPSFKLRKAPKKDLYWVVDDNNRHYSKDPLPKKKAQQQQKALYASYGRKLKGGVKLKVKKARITQQTNTGTNTREAYIIRDTDPATRNFYNAQLMNYVFDDKETAKRVLEHFEEGVVDQYVDTATVGNYRRYIDQLAQIGESPTEEREEERRPLGNLSGRFIGKLASKVLTQFPSYATRKPKAATATEEAMLEEEKIRKAEQQRRQQLEYERMMKEQEEEVARNVSRQNRLRQTNQQPQPPSTMTSNVVYVQPNRAPIVPLLSSRRIQFENNNTTSQQQPTNIPQWNNTSTMNRRASPKEEEEKEEEKKEDEEDEEGKEPKSKKVKKGVDGAGITKRPYETELQFQERLIKDKQQQERLASKGITPEMRTEAIVKSNIARKKQQLKDIESQMATQRAYEMDPEIISKRAAIQKKQEENKFFNPLLSTLVNVGDVIKEAGILPKPLSMAYEAFRPDVEGIQQMEQQRMEQQQQKEQFGQQYNQQLEQQAQKLRQELSGVAGSGRFSAARYFDE